MENKEFLGTERIGKLLFKLALPSVVAQLVNLLYNMVDRVYIGHMENVGSLALTGVGVCMPVILLVSAFAALVGMGGAPQVSIYMGKKDYKTAEKIMGNCFVFLIFISIVLTGFLYIFGEDLLLIFGASENTIGYAIDYMNIYVIGTIFDTYIILSKGNSMYLLDQHAAHEKILYERYMDKFYKSRINMQMLLDPIVLELSNIDMLHVENNLDLFMKFGFEIELFGKNHIMIRCVPTIFGVPESEKFILQIIDNIEEIKNNYELKGEKFASMACRAAIKANDRIQSMEIRSLLNELETCENPFTCPHGRPTIVEITKTEIEKMFKRIM